MGLYLNPGNEAFKMNLGLRIYVDKSMIVDELNSLFGTTDGFLCVSRPRRFGKSMVGNLISAYYSKGCDSRALFDKLNISKGKSYESHLNKVNVIKLDINGFYQKYGDKLFDTIHAFVREEFVQEFPQVTFSEHASIGECILRVFAKTKETFVIIIDEYDVLVREQVPQQTFKDYLNFLSGLFKDTTLRPAISLAYLTGILPVVRDRIQSKMNEFDEYSMLNARNLSEFVGFTSNETEDICKQYGMDFDECCRWYDGYHMKGYDIFNPKSVVTSITNKEFDSYWSATGSFEALRDYILMNFEGIKDDVITMIGGGHVEVDVTMYMNTMTDFRSKDDVFTYLIHLGYLAYERDDQTCYIPNEEVRREWVKSIKTSADYTEIMKIVNDSKRLLQATIDGDEHAVEESLNEAHMRATNNLTYNDEASFQSAIGLAYFYANTKYTVIKELPTGKGFADIALIPYVPNIPAMIIELKNNKTAEGAIEQIRSKRYDDVLRKYRGDLLFVGVNYDANTKEHTCKIEKLVM